MLRFQPPGESQEGFRPRWRNCTCSRRRPSTLANGGTNLITTRSQSFHVVLGNDCKAQGSQDEVIDPVIWEATTESLEARLDAIDFLSLNQNLTRFTHSALKLLGDLAPESRPHSD